MSSSTEQSPEPTPNPNPSLPDDLLVSCIARVSRLYYPTLSLVSKSFRSLIASPELYKVRSSLGNTEISLYMCLRFEPDLTPCWYTLCRKPKPTIRNEETSTDNKQCEYVLASIQAPRSPCAHLLSGLVSIGSDIYNIGHKFGNKGTSRVSILDCRSHTWREAPSMQVERSNPAVNVVDGKIYVAGGCRDDTKWMEVFDPKTQAWEVVSRPSRENWGIHVSKSAAFDKKVYMFGNRNDSLAYKPKEGTLENVGWHMEYNWRWHSNCVIENVLYSFHQGKFLWYDSKVMVWRRVNGVEYSTKSFRVCMADYGGKMAVFSAMPPDGNRMKTIWCAVIALERRTKKNIWGKVEWHDAVLTVSDSCILEYALSATV